MNPAIDAANAANWWSRQLLMMAMLAVALLLTFEYSRLDLWLEGFFFDPALGDFPLRRHWFFDQIMYHGLKQANYVLLMAAGGVGVLGLRGKLAWLPPRNALLAMAGTLLIPLTSAALKQLTYRHCPWDIVDFGGYAPYVGLLEHARRDIAQGMCFPAGHASGGLAWLAWALALGASLRGVSRRILIFALTLGLAMGLARMAQGAHFLSHTLWSAWWAWALSLALARLTGARLPFGSGEMARDEQEPPDGQRVRQSQ